MDPLLPLLHKMARWTGIDLSKDARAGSLRRFVEGRVRTLGLPSVLEYVAGLSGTGDPEVRRLLDAITVNHTWFYRDPAQMAQIAGVIAESAGRRKTTRIWVPGCATGEDAYTLAMLGAQAGCPLAVLGSDISERAIPTPGSAATTSNRCTSCLSRCGRRTFCPPGPARWRSHPPCACR